jgi:hypothetical protein
MQNMEYPTPDVTTPIVLQIGRSDLIFDSQKYEKEQNQGSEMSVL